MWEAWRAGDRKKALEPIPDEVIDDTILWGSPEVCREKIQRYVDAGVTPALALMHPGAATSSTPSGASHQARRV